MNLRKKSIVYVATAVLVLLMCSAIGLVGCGDDSGSTSNSGSSGTITPSNNGTTTQDDTSSDTYQEVNIAKLAGDYSDSHYKADTLYKDKKIQIVGKVISVVDLRMLLATEDDDIVIVAVYAATLASVNGEAGDIVTVKGVCAGLGTGEDASLVKMTNCLIES